MQEHRARVGGIDMRWEEAGEGLPVVLVHGIPTSPALWRHVVPRVEGARCLAFEMVGYGASIPAGRERDISVAAQAGYLLDWLREIGIERAVLAGHDLGGGVVQIAAARHRDICAGLFLTNAICYDSWPIPSVKAFQLMGGLARHKPNWAFKQVLRMFFRRGHETADAAKEALRMHWPHYAAHGGAEAFVRQVRALDARDTMAVAGELPALGVPARIAWGAADGFQKLKYGERLSRDLNAPLLRIEKGRHFTPEDHPEVIAREISRLVAEV